MNHGFVGLIQRCESKMLVTQKDNSVGRENVEGRLMSKDQGAIIEYRSFSSPIHKVSKTLPVLQKGQSTMEGSSITIPL